MVKIYSDREIEYIRSSAELAVKTLQLLKAHIKPDIFTKELDRIAYEYLISKGAQPAFLGYKGYPSSICIAINEEVVHGIPDYKRKLKEGDIIGIDVGVLYNGYYGDAGLTVPVGKISQRAENLLAVARLALHNAIKNCVVGKRLGDISYAIQHTARLYNYSEVHEFVGHGIGKELHEAPPIPNYGKPNTGLRLKKGMVFAIEVMINEGTSAVKLLENKWTAVTADRSLSAHFEHVVAVKEDYPLILSKLNGKPLW